MAGTWRWPAPWPRPCWRRLLPQAPHNGRTAFAGAFGPYDVTATIEYRHEGGEQGVALDLYLRTRSRRPVDDAEVTVTARDGDHAVGPLRAGRFGNNYQVLIPDDDAYDWDVTLLLTGAGGEVTVTRAAPAPAVAAVGVLAAGLGLLDRRRGDAVTMVFGGSAGLAVLCGW